ncbi:MAG: glycosyltransferase family 4 protein [Bacteroidia bacterium]|nr:glycosyltransferase family 4 protein [Bacteroidia bacterium]MDW8159327.1 glycosyltransferase family 4 protein [Bacteroidia bacterium]
MLNTYDRIGGAAIACMRLWEALKMQNVNVNLLVQEGRIESPLGGVYYLVQGPFSYKLAQLRLFLNKAYLYFYDKNKGLNFAFEAPFFGARLSTLPLIQKSDILHLHWVNHGFISFSTLREFQKLKKKIVWTLHDMWAFTGGCYYSQGCEYYRKACGNCFFLKRPKPNDFSHRLWKKKYELYAHLDLTIVTCSKWLAECAAQSSLLKDKRIVTIPNPLNTEIFKPMDKVAVRQKLGLPQDKYLLIFASAKIEDRRKGFTFFQKALEQLRSIDPNWNEHRIAIVLLGKSGAHAFSSIEGYSVYYLGNLETEESIAQAYSACDILINPSLADNLPNTIMEAMACGVPVVAFSTGGIPEMVMHQKNGFLVPTGSSEGLAEGIRFLLSDLERYAHIQNAAIQFVHQNYSYSLVAKCYLTLYQEILANAYRQ